MSLNNFIPELWSANILSTLEKSHIFANLANRSYEGEISQAGDTVRINMVGEPTINTYTKDTDIADPEALTDAQTILTIDQQKYFNFQIDDIDKRQGNVQLMNEATRKAGYKLRDVVDTFFAGKYSEAGMARNTSASPVDLTTLNVEDEILAIQETFNDASIPMEGRFLVVAPWVLSKLIGAGLTTKTVNDGLWANGLVDRIFGFDILVSTNVSKNSSSWDITRNIAGVRGQSFTFAEQIASVEAYRPEKRFADAMKGLHVYGGKCIRPDMTLVWYADKTAEA
jgi:hypothetical protein